MELLIFDLLSQIKKVLVGGGAAALKRNKSRSKLLPRERIDRLLDPDASFLELSQVIEMASKENYPGLIRPSNFPGARFGGSKLVKEVGPENPQQRALRDVLNITKDTVNPCVINKRCFSSHMVQQCPKDPEALSLTLASNLSGDQEAKKPNLYAANPSGPVDSNIIDVEDGGDEASDAAVPMYLKHTEAVLHETYRMELSLLIVEELSFPSRLSFPSGVSDYFAQGMDLANKSLSTLIEGEISISYGNKGNEELLYLYGFVIDGNPDDYLMVHYLVEAIQSLPFSDSKVQLLEAHISYCL